MQFYVGEALVGDGNEVAHIDLMLGSKDGPVGTAFANALSTQSDGHTNLLAVLEPNVAVKPSTVMISAPSHSTPRTMQLLTGAPSNMTVQAPHSPPAQPFFVPVRPIR